VRSEESPVVAPTPRIDGSVSADSLGLRSVRNATVGAVAAWGLLVLAATLWGNRLNDRGVRIVLDTPPILGDLRHSLVPFWSLPIVIGVVLVIVLPPIVDGVRWWAMVAIAAVSSAVWWVGLALVDGFAGLTRGIGYDVDYRTAAREVAADPGRFLSGYVQGLPGRPIALRGHPPGFALLFGGLERIGLHGPWAATVLTLAGGLLAVPAVLVTVRVVAGVTASRRVAPFLVLAPAALWIATSTDAFSMGTAAVAVALLAVAGSRDRLDAVSVVLAVAAGLVGASVALQSYGLILMALPTLAVAVLQRRAWPVVIAGVVTVGALVVVGAAGFWWTAGLSATTHEYVTLDLDRPYGYFLLADLAAWALALGPATFVGLARVRMASRGLRCLVLGGLAAAALAWISGLSKGEVERIWLPFTIWVVPIGAVLWTSRRAARGWLAAQVAVATVLNLIVRTAW
jgi:hypothetical protein